MKPLNANEKGCDPISSNCVIWQGNDIPCINLCKGDTVSEVVYKVATELCEIVETLNITTYEEALAVFNLAIGAGAPANFEQLIEFILDRIHNLEECTGCAPDCNGDSELVLPEEVSTPCCDAEVSIASCFYYYNETGDLMNVMSLNDYVHTIGNKLCDVLTTLEANGITLENHEIRLRTLETKPDPTYVPPRMTPTGVLPSVETDPFVVLTELEKQFVELVTATGTPDEILALSAIPPAILNGDQLCRPNVPMSAIIDWISNPITLAENIEDMWHTIEDLRCGVQNVMATLPLPCETFDVVINASYSTPSLEIWFQGNVPSGFTSQYLQGVEVTIEDTAHNRHTVWINFESYITSGTPFVINVGTTPLDPNLNFNITGTARIVNSITGVTCEKVFSYYLVNTSECPNVTLSAPSNGTQVNWWLGSDSGVHTYTVEIWDNAGAAMIQSSSFTTSGITVTPGVFTGLTPATTYRVRVHVTTGSNTLTCPDQIITTAATPCYPATGVAASTSIP